MNDPETTALVSVPAGFVGGDHVAGVDAMTPVDTEKVNLIMAAMSEVAKLYEKFGAGVQVSRVLTVNGMQIRVTVEREADAVRRRLEDLTSDKSYDA